MAYIIGEPIIEYCGKNNGYHVVEVRFPVKESLTETLHYRGIAIKLKPECLWMLHQDGAVPQVLPALIKEVQVAQRDMSYAETLIETAERQKAYEKSIVRRDENDTDGSDNQG